MEPIAIILAVSIALLVAAIIMAPRVVLTLLGVLVLGGVSFGLLVGLLGIAGFVLWLATVVVAAMTFVQLRLNQQRAILDLLLLAAEKQMPLTSVVRAFAADQSVGGGRRFGRFADDLQAGVSLGDALLRTPSVLPRQAVLAAKLGEQTGSLVSALRSAASGYTLGLPLRQALLGRVFYLTWMAFLAPALVAFIGIKILPSLIKIFEDFETSLPSMTTAVVHILSNRGVQWLGVLLPVWMTALLIYVGLYYIGVVPAPKFGLGFWLERGPLLRALALAVESQRPLGVALDCLAESYPNRSVALRLHKAAAEVTAGGDWAQTLVKYSLIGPNAAAVMQSAQRVGNLPWAMRQVAEASERRLAYRLEAALNIISPLLILGLGGLVGFFVVGCFLPLLKLIVALT